MSEFTDMISFEINIITGETVLGKNTELSTAPKIIKSGIVSNPRKIGDKYKFTLSDTSKINYPVFVHSEIENASSFIKDGNFVTIVSTMTKVGMETFCIFEGILCDGKMASLQKAVKKNNDYHRIEKEILEAEKKSTPRSSMKEDISISSLSPFFQRFCKKQLKGTKHTEANEVPKRLTDNEAKTIFSTCKHTYPVDTQRAIDMYLNSHKTNDMTKAKTILSINTAYEKERFTSKELMSELNKKVYGLETVKQDICNTVCAKINNGEGLKLLIVGPEGCGKNLLASTIADLRKKEIITIPYYSYSNQVDIAGCNSVFDNSTIGAIGKKLSSVGTTDVSFIFEKIDGANHGDTKNGDPDVTLEGMLSDGIYNDLWLEAGIDTSCSWIMATAEDEDKISSKIKAAFDKIVYIQPYTEAQRLEIAKRYILPSIMKKSSHGQLLFSDKLISYIFSTFCYDEGFTLFIKNATVLLDDYCGKNMWLYNGIYSKEEIDELLGKENLDSNPIALIFNNKDNFSEEDFSLIKKMITASQKSITFGNKEKENAIKQLKYLSDIFKNTVCSPEFNYKDFKKKVDATHDGLEDVKNIFARAFNHQSKSGKGKNILLISAPGQGKTTIARSAAKAYGLPFFKISCNGVGDPNYFKGSIKTVTNSTPGRIIEAVAATGKKAVILLDEIDKINIHSSFGYATVSALLDLLDEKQFSDHFFDGVKIDLSSLIICATANNANNIPPELYDRFEVVTIPAYTKEQKKSIFKNYVAPSVFEECMCRGEICFSEKAVDFLIENFTFTGGARELYANAKKIVENMLLFKNSLAISVDDVIKILGVPFKKFTVDSNNCIPGKINGLSVNSFTNLGAVSVVECVKTKGCDKLTGLLEGSCKESVTVARTVAENIIPECHDSFYHIHFGAGKASVTKDGSSAGITLALAILSAQTEIPIDSRLAFTGELSVTGAVYAIGGTEQKISAAIEAGCEKVLIPMDNYELLKSEDVEKFSSLIEIVPIKHISEAVKVALPKLSIKKAA